MDRYTEEEQAYERVALGLSVAMGSYRRADDSSLSNAARTFRGLGRVRKRASARKDERNGNNGNRSPDKKSEPEPDEDSPERQERRKTPPSPCGEA